MSRSSSIRVSIAVLASSLLLNVILVSCAAKATLPPQGDGPGDGSGTEFDQSALMARFDSVMARLTLIEAKADQQAETLAQQAAVLTQQTEILNQQVASGTQQTLTIGSQIDSLASTIAMNATDPSIATRQVARLDSVLALASYLADDSYSAGWEICGQVDAGLGVAINPNAEVFGEAAGDAGAWAGTGAFAGAQVHAGLVVGLEAGLSGGLSLGGCLPVLADPPPSRSAQGGQGFPDRLKTTLTDAAERLGLTEARVTTTLTNLSSGMSSPGSMRIQDAVNYLPLPPQFASITNDPIGHLTQKIPARINDAVDALCNRNWGTLMSETVPVACDRIDNDLFDISGIFSLFEQFPEMQLALDGLQTGFETMQGAVNTVEDGIASVQSAVGSLASGLVTVQTQVLAAGSTVASVCSKINQVGGANLTIPNPLPGPDNLFDGEIFPFYSPIGC